jgi:hypothetical protein
MGDRWQFQLRITVSDERSRALRADPTSESYIPLRDLLRRHHAFLKCQFDAFADYVNEAERIGPALYPLYEWTRQTIENREKRAKYRRSFTVYVDGSEVYRKEIADLIETELSALLGKAGIEHVSMYDTNPANNPQPPEPSR